MTTTNTKLLPTREYLLECFDYDKQKGKLYWKERPLSHFSRSSTHKSINNQLVGKEAGSINGKGYKHVTINGVAHYVHRIIYFLEYDMQPKMLDHINRDRLDNRPFNLRPTDATRNRINSTHNNKWGQVGVVFNKASKKFRAMIKYQGKQIHLGLYPTVEGAILARKEAEHFYGFDLIKYDG